MTTLEEFKQFLEENGHPKQVSYSCPECGTDAPEDDREPIDDLMVWNPNHGDCGGNGWMCVCCDSCGNYYAADISN